MGNRANVMVLGTASHVGKSRVALGLCRILARDGVSVAPFKAQNMALNAFVTEDGGEMGWAQALQAMGAGLVPHVDMNPVLVKPGASGAQVIVNGRLLGTVSMTRPGDFYPERLKAAQAAFKRLAAAYPVVVLEGAGSPVELNLMAQDLANLDALAFSGAHAVLVADIDRGGVFAHVWGTLELLPAWARRRLVGIIINKFRGDPGYFEEGRHRLEMLTNLPVLGVLPYVETLLPEEDGVSVRVDQGPLDVAMVALPHMSNFTDLDPLLADPGIRAGFVRQVPTGRPAMVLLPGSKNTIADWHWLHRTGWADALRTWVPSGTVLMGICGGYQMLGRQIADPYGVEGPAGDRAEVLGFFPMDTVLTLEKRTRQVCGVAVPWERVPVHGYELHMGQSVMEGSMPPLIRLDADGTDDGAIRRVGQGWVLGTYVHDVFEEPGFAARVLALAGLKSGGGVGGYRQRGLAAWEGVMRQHVDVARLLELAGV